MSGHSMRSNPRVFSTNQGTVEFKHARLGKGGGTWVRGTPQGCEIVFPVLDCVKTQLLQPRRAREFTQEGPYRFHFYF